MKSFSPRSLSWVTVTFIGILLIAAILRLVNLAQIPPGLYHDEAQNGLDIWNILTGQRLPIFFEANGGREPLFIYLQAVSVWLFGPSAWALRIVSALIGIATVGVFYLAAREMTPKRFDAKTFALVACAGLATSYWHLHWSRVGLRAILLPLLLCAALYFFLVARRTAQTRYAILSGFFLGLSFYSYLAARLAPFLFLAFLALDWQQTRKLLRQNILLLVTALVLALPLAFYFIQTPDAFASRTGDIALTSNTNSPLVQALAINVARVAGMFFVQGDVEWRHGLSLRPVLDPLAAILFVGGVGFSFMLRREASMRLAWIWLLVMLLPTVLSQQAPDTLRSIGAVPVVYWFVAVGWAFANEWGMKRLGGTPVLWMIAGVLLLIVGSGFFTVRDYWNWANDRRAYRDFDGEFTEIAQWINSQRIKTYVPLEIYSYPTVQFLTLARGGTLTSIINSNVQSLAQQGGVALVSEAEDKRDPYVVIGDGQTIALNPVQLPPFALTGTVQGRYRALTGIAQFANNPFDVTRQPNFTPADAIFDGIKLVGYQLDSPKLSLTQPLGVTLYWERTGAVPHEPEVFVQVMDGKGQEIERADEFPTLAISVALYPIGQIIPDRHIVKQNNLPGPGRYALQVGLLDPLNGEPWDVSINGARDDHVVLNPLYVPLGSVDVPPTAQRVSAQWANGIVLEAYKTDTTEFTAGDSSQWTLYWQTQQALAQDDTIFVQLVNTDGKIVAQADHDPMQGSYPTTIWQVGQTIPDAFTLAMPADLPKGTYRLYIGWYNRASNQRTGIASPSASDNAFLLQSVQVK